MKIKMMIKMMILKDKYVKIVGTQEVLCVVNRKIKLINY